MKMLRKDTRITIKEHRGLLRTHEICRNITKKCGKEKLQAKKRVCTNGHTHA
jgi:hypothetical protein